MRILDHSAVQLVRWFVLLLITTVSAAFGAEPVFISEFLASNNGGLRDEDGDTSDWIEIFNSGTNTANMDGWFLTDAAANLTKWRIPSVNIPPNGFLIVFASGKNRTVAGAPLHANFNLSASGEYLALVHPDGNTIASEFAPAFPEQFGNISYGIGQNLQVTKFISNTSPATVFIPSNSTLGTSWTAVGFTDPTWRAGTNGIGYETYVPGFAIMNIRAMGGVCDLGTADAVLVTPSLQASVFTETRGVVNYHNTGGGANFGGDFTFPGMTMNVDENNFVTEARGIVTIPTSGNWTFGVNSDDGFRVDIGANTFSYPPPRGPGDTFATFNLAAGEYPVRLVFYECGGGAEVEFFAAFGPHSSFNGNFRLVGDTVNGGLAVKSLPTGNAGTFRPQIATDVQTNMLSRNGSAYIRMPFNVVNPGAFSTLTLRMKYDDGFVAYLNGVEVARRNAPVTPQWNSVATANRPTTNALVFEDIDLTGQLTLLQSNANVLAIHGLNDSSASSDFLILAELVENKVLGLANHYFSTPSPGAVNGSGTFAFVENLKFTPGRGWFDTTNFSITITSATPGITIRYTTNGSVPSTTNGIVYTSGGILANGTRLIRAIGYRNGFEPTEVETHSYIFLNQVQAQSTANGSVGGSSGNYTLDANITQSAQYGPTFKSDLLGVPTLSIVMDWNDVFGPSGVWSNPQAEGVAWERPCSLEYMRPDGEDGFEVNCGIRIQGGASRFLVEKHGFRVLFKNVYGPGKLEYPLYSDSPVQEFDTLTLHATFNDHWLWGGAQAQMIRDQWCRDTQNAMGGYGPHGTYVHLYLNGLYWGLYNIGEKGDASYAASYLGGEKEEYDAFNSDENIDGDRVAWDAMFSIANGGLTTDAAYTNLSRYLNIPNFIDYMLMNFYGGNGDWPWHNWNAARRRVPGAGFHFFSWDAEWTFGIGSGVGTDRTGLSDGSPGQLYAQLRGHPEFRIQFGDHAQKHLFNGGALTPAVADARWMTRAAEIDRAIVCESARWGNGHTRDTWLSAQSSVRSWFPQRGAILLNQLRNAGLFPILNAPTFGPFGGLVPPGYSLALTNPNPTGVIYYTTDGSDPRLWGGGLAASARAYTGPLTMTNAMLLRTRVRDAGNWSAIVEAPFYIVQDFAALKVTEIMYHPPVLGTNTSDDLEFLELKNTGASTLDLGGLQFTDGITFNFTNGTRLAPGAFFVLANNANSFAVKYPGIVVNGIYTGRLNNGGERLTLEHVLGTNVFSFSYNNAVPWPLTPDGYGFSLVPASLAGDPDSASSWRASANLGGSPGADDPAVSISGVVINEILTHTDPPQIDAIELHNPTANGVNIGGWFLSDDAAAPKQFRIPDGTTIPPGGFTVFYETNFNAQPGVPPSFALSSHGESLFLFSGDANTNLTGYSHSFDFGAAANGVSFGRYVNSIGDEDWPAMAAVTLGASNSAPRIGPLVINEVMYHPPIGYEEFIEIVNISSNAVPLYDSAFPTNKWKLSGLGYTFSNNVSVPAGGYLLLVPINPLTFRTKYTVPASAQIVGPYSGALQDSGERLRLERPDSPDTNGTPYIVMDEVRYNDKMPWPLGADGDGPSLQRSALNVYGNEPTNWFASGITPGTANVLNQAPTVALTFPTNGAAFDVPASIFVAASAFDSDGTIVRVEFYDGDIKIGEDTTSPFNITWSSVPVGSHTLVAKARDNGLAIAVSEPVTITVNPPPIGNGIGLRGDYFGGPNFSGTRIRRVDSMISFDWGEGAPDPAIPANQFSVRWTGQVQPRFSESYTFYTVSDDGIRLWVNNQLIIDRWVDQSPTESSGVIALQAGSLNDIRVEYYENGGGAVAQLFWSSPSTTKELIPSTQLYPPVSSNLPPSVTLTSPATGSVFVATSPVNITANANDPDGAVFKVEFFANNTKVGEDTTMPFSLTWSGGAAGNYDLTAVVTDDSGIIRTSAPVNISFLAGFTTNVTLVGVGSVWKYFDNGSDQGTAWREIVFNDSGWNNGAAQLGYGDSDEVTRVEDNPTPGYNQADQNRYITTYFRRAFTLTDPASFTALNLRVMRDDGVVVYLNGSEVFRHNMPGGVVGYTTLASGNISGVDESTFYSSVVNPGYLVFGTNVIAVEIHQASAASSDISFDFELAGVQSYVAPSFTTQPQSLTVGVGSNVSFSATVAGNGPLFRQWRFNGANIAGATNSTLVISNAQFSHSGNYVLLVTNMAGAATSHVAVLAVESSDFDNDGMLDSWEITYGLDRTNPNDAHFDTDGDGMTNLQEFRASTDPTDPLSVLRLIITGLNPLQMQFTAQSNLTYSIQFNTNIGLNTWFTLSNFSAKPSIRTLTVTDVNPPTNRVRFYRAVMP